MDSDDGVPATPENARVYAEFIARKAAEISGAHLDFSPGSLAEVDAIVEGFRKDGETAESIGATLFSFGCYVGEVFVRNSGGAWKNADGTPMKGFSGSPIVVELPNGSICNPVGKVFKRLQRGKEDSLTYFYQAFASHSSK
jgi:hypothetical protein